MDDETYVWRAASPIPADNVFNDRASFDVRAILDIRAISRISTSGPIEIIGISSVAETGKSATPALLVLAALRDWGN